VPQVQQKGHWARDCRSKPKKEAVNTTQEEESLMLITATPWFEPQQMSVAGVSKAVDMAAHIVHLCEEKVFAQLGEREEHDSKSWICDTRAMNHMSGSWAASTELDAAVRDTARFGDDSVAEIEERGSVVFICKNGEHRSFAGVYFIPRLMANIVSVGQLDEAGYDIHIKNARMDVREPGGRLLARVQRKENMLYVFDVNVAQRANCLVAREDMEARRWHARLGHVNMPELQRMANRDLVRGLPHIRAVDDLCEACMASRGGRHSWIRRRGGQSAHWSLPW
jgi:hypothetical protein